MKILLTGASGFIGKHIQKEFTKHHIIPISLQKVSIETLSFAQVDTIIHLSALVHQMTMPDDANAYEKINVTQTLELAKSAKASGVKHFIFMSTIKVYGEESDLIYTENSPCSPQDDYGKSKRKAELQLQTLQDHNFIVSIIRTPIVYGEGVKANMKNLIDLIKAIPVLPFAKIHNSRSMVYVGNLTHLIDVLLEQKQSGVYLAGDDVSPSTSQLIHYIAQALDKKVYLIRIPGFEFLLKTFKPSYYQRLFESLIMDNSETKRQLNLTNPYRVEDGIRLMLEGMHL
ncbi:MAG: NAD-dependent epimerase/dehydratase family protein [Sulfuricurvum sp.]|nr:NAD-dependent epimerase/dehydratase family protein [Sulfuricurvum sp.]